MKKIIVLVIALAVSACNIAKLPFLAKQEYVSTSQIADDISKIRDNTEGNEVKNANQTDSGFSRGWFYSIDDLRCFAPANDADRKDGQNWSVYLKKVDDNNAEITLNIGAIHVAKYTDTLSGKLVLRYVKQGETWKFLNVDSKDLVRGSPKTDDEAEKFMTEQILPLCKFSRYESEKYKKAKSSSAN